MTHRDPMPVRVLAAIAEAESARVLLEADLLSAADDTRGAVATELVMLLGWAFEEVRRALGQSGGWNPVVIGMLHDCFRGLAALETWQQGVTSLAAPPALDRMAVHWQDVVARSLCEGGECA